MTRPRWAARAGKGAIVNRENTERNARSLLSELVAGPDFTGAACTQTDGDLWYPEKGRTDVAKVAQTLCHGGMIHGKAIPPCPVRKACLAYALDSEDWITHWGTWGGYTAKKIRRMRNLRTALRAAGKPKDVAA